MDWLLLSLLSFLLLLTVEFFVSVTGYTYKNRDVPWPPVLWGAVLDQTISWPPVAPMPDAPLPSAVDIAFCGRWKYQLRHGAASHAESHPSRRARPRRRHWVVLCSAGFV
jgi:hypothetical protein